MRINMFRAFFCGLGLFAMTGPCLAVDVEPTPELPTSLSIAFADPVAAPDAGKAAEVPPPPAETPAYKGGRGLITAQGMSGMFINPTSGTLDQGQFTIQYCAMMYYNDGPNNTAHGVMAAYGIFDWLEVGVSFQAYDIDVTTAPPSNDGEIWGPFVRIRLLKDAGWTSDGWFIPEASIGAIWIDGSAEDDLYSRTEWLVMFSKRIPLDEDGFFKGIRGHFGIRRIYRPELPAIGIPPANAIPGYSTTENDTLIYGGGELELPHAIKLVAEISSSDHDSFHNHLPWAVGVQWMPNNVLGLSIAGVSSQGEDRVSLYVGIGAVLKF